MSTVTFYTENNTGRVVASSELRRHSFMRAPSDTPSRVTSVRTTSRWSMVIHPHCLYMK